MDFWRWVAALPEKDSGKDPKGSIPSKASQMNIAMWQIEFGLR
jgi:hypothetical protein